MQPLYRSFKYNIKIQSTFNDVFTRQGMYSNFFKFIQILTFISFKAQGRKHLIFILYEAAYLMLIYCYFSEVFSGNFNFFLSCLLSVQFSILQFEFFHNKNFFSNFLVIL